MGKGPSVLTGPVHVNGAVGAYKVSLPQTVTDANIGATPPISSEKLIQRVNLTWSDPISSYVYTRTYCLAANVNYCHLLAFGAWQWAMPAEPGEYTRWLLYAYRGTESIVCLQTELRLYGSDAAKTIKWGAVADPIGEPIYLTAGYSLWLVRTTAASGASESGYGGGCVLVFDEYPLRGGIKTQFGLPVGYG